ncbi:MAG: ABC transporter substrate-binding protein [Oscillospiraceae bacterium]|nr:ABC transporter substrate-binding protein [Oscillospiraceae bacterium]
MLKIATRGAALFIAAALLAALCSCGSDGKTEKDERPPQYDSVVAVSKSVGELWLLAGGELAGVTEDAMELEGLSADTVSVGTLTEPNLEAIVALEPDMVLLMESVPTQKELAQRLEELGISCMPVDIDDFAGYKAVMEQLTGLTGRDDLYRKNCLDVEEKIESVRQKGSELPRGTFLALKVSATKNKALDDSYFACEIMRDMNLTNIAAGDRALDELSLEAVVAAEPDYIFVIPSGDESKARESFDAAFADKPVWRELSAVKNGRVFMLPKDYFMYKPNDKWGDAYEYLYELICK